ncbi:DNA polymerase I, partial [Patescibacteria group bacterium]|nr:DNA polymerase I [Patescibacteria group bacterium]
ISQYRELAKIKSTYADALPKLISPKTGRIHTTFNQVLTATGRLSSSNPNLQNIPTKTEIGNEIRMAFVPENKDWLLLSLDYSQIELRIVASMSIDEKMIGIFAAGGDIHTETAAEIQGVAPEQVTEKMRNAAKALNFGIIYGMSSHGFSQATGMPREEAQDFIDRYLARFYGVSRFIEEAKESAQKNGYAETVFGRRRWLPELNSPNFQVRSAAERMAINMPIQGTAADIIKLAMVSAYGKYKNDPDINMVLQVHDELVFEAKKEKAAAYAEEIKKIMENVYMLRVPLKASASIGENWGEMEEVKN